MSLSMGSLSIRWKKVNFPSVRTDMQHRREKLSVLTELAITHDQCTLNTGPLLDYITLYNGMVMCVIHFKFAYQLQIYARVP